MSLKRYLIAGLKIEMEVGYPMLSERSEKYRCDFGGDCDMSIIPTAEQIDLFKKDHPRLSDDAVEYLVTGALFYYRLLNFGGFMLHSSCIAYNGKAYIFTADSGTGKSTHTSLWQQYVSDVVMINDDKPAVKLIDGQFYAIGTPWSGKTAQNTDTAVPVGGVVLLNRGKVNTVRSATAAESIPFILRQTIFPSKPETSDLLIDLLDKFISTTPIYRLECDISEQAVITSFEALTGEKYIKRQ